VQAFVEEAGIPAINEMRYAGYHLIAALGDDGSLVSASELTKAKNHANRACYEAGEAGILCALDVISIFKYDYRSISVSPVVPTYSQILIDADAANARVSAEREHGDDRIVDHDDFIEKFKLLKEHCKTLESAREELNKLERKERREGRRFIIGTAIAVGTLIAAIWAIIPHKEASKAPSYPPAPSLPSTH
jgi:hypothetical protein